jgi:hypothetical protein
VRSNKIPYDVRKYFKTLKADIFIAYQTLGKTYFLNAEQNQVLSNFSYTNVSSGCRLYFYLGIHDYKDWTTFCANFLEINLI